MNLDETAATQALSYRLTEWGVDGAAEKARHFVETLIGRGWVMDPKAKPTPRHPPPDEECRDHPGEWRVNCRPHAAERKAQRDEVEHEQAERARLTKAQAIEAARQGIRAHHPTKAEESA